jgi:hypothetical protein
MKLTNTQLENFVSRIKLKKEDLPKYQKRRDELIEKLENKIKNDKRNDLKVTRTIIAGSWKKGTILRKTGDYPIDIDLVIYVEGDEDLKTDIKRIHEFIEKYLEDIYPNEAKREIDAEGKTKSIKITFTDIGFEVDVVPVVPLKNPADYVWQPQRGGGGDYTTSVTKQLSFATECKTKNPSYASIVRALKWWRNEKELKPSDEEPGLSSYGIELIVAYLDITKGIEENIEEAIIRFFTFLSTSNFPVIKFAGAINSIPQFETPIYIADNTNNENNSVKKLIDTKWKVIIKEADIAFEALHRAISRNHLGDTIEEWREVFGKSFNIKEIE